MSPRLHGIRERRHQPAWDTNYSELEMRTLASILSRPSWRRRAYEAVRRFTLFKLFPERLRWKWLMRRRIRLLASMERGGNIRNYDDSSLMIMLDGIQQRDVM